MLTVLNLIMLIKICVKIISFYALAANCHSGIHLYDLEIYKESPGDNRFLL